MSYRKISKEIEKNKVILRENITDYWKSFTVKRHVPLVETSFAGKSRILLKRDIVGHFKHLAPLIEGRKDRLKITSKDSGS